MWFLLLQFHCAGLRGNYLQNGRRKFCCGGVRVVASHPPIPGAQMLGTRGNHHLWEDSPYFLRHPGHPPLKSLICL